MLSSAGGTCALTIEHKHQLQQNMRFQGAGNRAVDVCNPEGSSCYNGSGGVFGAADAADQVQDFQKAECLKVVDDEIPTPQTCDGQQLGELHRIPLSFLKKLMM